MISIALLSFLIFLPKSRYKLVLGFLFSGLAYSIYFHLGASHHLAHYYSDSERAMRESHLKMRPLFSAMKKQEGRLQLKIKEDPNDILSRALLLELLGIEALQKNEYEMAIQFWDQALAFLPTEGDYDAIRKRIIEIKLQVVSKYKS